MSTTSSFSIPRAILYAAVGGALVWAWMSFQESRYQKEARESTAAVLDEVFPLANPVRNRHASAFNDEDHDLVADPPSDSSQFINPQVIRFSFISSPDVVEQSTLWEPLMKALSDAVGRPVEYLPAKNVEEQLSQLKEQELHVTALNTGAVPRAVNTCGFVPVSTIGDASGAYGYSMQIIVPAESSILGIEDLRGKRITFTTRNSNSGFKAPVVLLHQDFGINPGRDYDFGFSTSHEESILRVAAGDIQAAPVASDLLKRQLAQDESLVDKVRVVYTSETFPPTAFGFLYNLDPGVVAALKAELTGFSLDTEGLQQEFATEGTRLVPVDYKQDWSVIRRIDDAMGLLHQVE